MELKLLIITYWVLLGIWTSYKRRWYKDCPDIGFAYTCIVFNILLSPFALCISLFTEFINKKWED